VRILRILIHSAFALFLIGSSAARAQTTSPDRSDKPDTPQAKVHPGTASWQVPYEPITARQRWRWFVSQSVGPPSLAVGVVSAAISTARDKPFEYGPGWDGFGKRYGIRLSGVVTGNAMNAGLGALWGEDPRYFRVGEGPLGHRVRNIVVMTFMARRSDGHLAPAYARFIATPGNNFLTNAWRADSEATNSAALKRTALGFAGRLGANAFREFWPDARKLITHHDN
jgi:hypothetical protein